MERKRKGYLLRKSTPLDNHQPQQQGKGPSNEPDASCTCNDVSPSKSSRTYDLQTQTVTFGEEDSSGKQHKRFSASSLIRKFSSSSAEEDSSGNQKVKQSKPFSMDAPDLEEFYPVDDHPSPSTFTAWDAFLSGNQAFFREPASAYMDVIPEVEEDDMEALLESDTDDTGSSVSTVVDRFSSRNSTANSSFSERWKGAAPSMDVAHFDLEKVLSPFEKLEKELDAHQGSRDEDGRKKEILRGPIVVITNSSSCEDVHSEEDDSVIKSQNSHEENKDKNEGGNSAVKSNGSITLPEIPIQKSHESTTSQTKAISRPKLVNGCKNEKPSVKKTKSDTAIPIPPPPTNPKKKRSYPTPNIPPRMSLHVQARRTRSDPGTPDQPSRIPRPISSTNRSPVTAPKSSLKSNKSSKNSTTKKPAYDGSKLIKDTQTKHTPELKSIESEIQDSKPICSKESSESVKTQNLVSKEATTINESDSDKELDQNLPHPDSFVNDPCWDTDSSIKNSFADNPSWNKIKEESDSFVDDSCWKDSSNDNGSNPFRSTNKTNPFTNDTEQSGISFSQESNLIEKEEIPALQPKGQMTVAILVPPIPERPSLMKREKPVEAFNTPETVQDAPKTMKNQQIQDEHVTSQPATSNISNTDQSHAKPVDLDSFKQIPEANSKQTTCQSTENAEVQQSTDPSNSFWPVATKLQENGNDKFSVEKAEVDALFDNIEGDSASQHQRPIEDILQALDQLVSAPREMEISIDWGCRGDVNIRETPVLSAASGDGSTCDETDGMAEDRRRCIESLLKEVDECLRTHKVGPKKDPRSIHVEDSAIAESATEERTPLGPGTPDVPSAGYTAPSSPKEHDEAIEILSNNSSPDMLRHQKHDGQRSAFSTSIYTQDPKNHSPGCDDSGVFLEEPLVSSPETQTRSAISRLHNITQFQKEDQTSDMRQYSIPTEGIDSDDLGLASSSIDSADDLDGDPLPSTLQICPPTVTNRQKPPPVPARKSPPSSQKYNTRFSNELTNFDVTGQHKSPLSKSSSSGEDSNFGEGDLFEDQLTDLICHDENSKNILNHQKNEQSRFAMTKSFHEDTLLGLQKDNPESKSSFLARTLSTSKKLEVPDGLSKISDNSSTFKWKSEECLRTAAENKWSLTGRRFEKSVSVKDRIAMFSEMEANQSPLKKDLQRYGSENNIKTVAVSMENKKMDIPLTEDRKQQSCLSRDTKWQSLHNICKKSPEKEIYPSSNLKSALSIPSLAPSSPLDNPPGNGYGSFAIKLEVEPPKPIVSTYPETQLTNNKRYNYGLYSLKNLKNTEDLLSKKAAGSNLLSIIDSRKHPLRKLKGLVIPEKPQQLDGSKTLPTIVSSDSEGGTGTRDNRRASLPITVVTAAAASKSTSLPRNNNSHAEYQKQSSLLTEPPWKSERSSSNTLPKYSPAFKKRSLELPGSSLSPTPPSSLTSPLSPPPSSPSSICSSNASSTLQQNVFQFSLSHSKPVQPLLPEKALMSPTPSLQPSDVEYEGDNSEDSSHSAASPMRNAVRAPKEAKTAPPLGSGIVHYEKSNTFTSSAKSIALQPLLVETLVKTPPSSTSAPRAAVCISKTEIHLRRELPNTVSSDQKKPADNLITQYSRTENRISNGKDCFPSKSNESVTNEHVTSMHVNSLENRNGSYQADFLDSHIPFTQNGNSSTQNGYQPRSAPIILNSSSSLSHQQPRVVQDVMSNGSRSITKSDDVPVGKFRACPLNLQDRKSDKVGRRPLHSDESEEDDDDDSHSTLSHRTEDSRHTTTDDCLSDATTDSFEKPRLSVPGEVPSNLRPSTEDYASTEGYLSDASTDVSLRRFTHRPLDASTEEYLSDATAESPDPDWVSNRDPLAQDYRNRSYITRNNDSQATDGSIDLRPKRLSQQRTVLKASVEPSGSVQKFKALAEKWEQRADVVTSPPPPPQQITVTAPALPKREPPKAVQSAVLYSSPTSTVTKSKSSISGSLPPSLMPRNSSSTSSERKPAHPLRQKSPSPTETLEGETNGWTYCETVPTRRDSSGSNSSSSKTTLKEFEDTTSTLQDTLNSEPPVLNNRTISSSLRSDTWNNEPRNRRGADFSRTEYQPSTRPTYPTPKSSFSDIRRNFENGNKEEEKPAPRKKPAMLPDCIPAQPQSPPVALPRRASSSSLLDDIGDEDETRRLLEDARRQLQQEGGDASVLPVLLRREGMDGGSVGITLAGGADYEVKEITVHKVIAGSIADRDGRVMKGDRVMSINGRDVRGVSHGEALHILKAPNPRVLLILARSGNPQKGPQHADTGRSDGKRQAACSQQDTETFLVELQKDATGVGFSIEGGKDSPQGDRPLLVKRLFKGGAADKEGRLEEGDEILSVNNHPVTNMTRTEAWNFLKKLPEGVVRLNIKKSKNAMVS